MNIARTAQIYRQAIDDALAGKAYNPKLSEELDGLANRGYTDGFFVKRQIKAQQNYAFGSSNAAKQKFIGEVIAYDENSGLATVEAKNHFKVGDQIEIINPNGNRFMEITELFKDGEKIEAAKGSGWVVQMNLGKVDNWTLLAVNL